MVDTPTMRNDAYFAISIDVHQWWSNSRFALWGISTERKKNKTKLTFNCAPFAPFHFSRDPLFRTPKSNKTLLLILFGFGRLLFSSYLFISLVFMQSQLSGLNPSEWQK